MEKVASSTAAGEFKSHLQPCALPFRTSERHADRKLVAAGQRYARSAPAAPAIVAERLPGRIIFLLSKEGLLQASA